MGGVPVSDGAKRRTEAEVAKGKITATTVSAQVRAANRSRVVLKMTNDGANTVYVAYGPTAVKNEGDRLNAEGGTVTIDEYTGEVTLVTAEGESNVCFTEV